MKISKVNQRIGTSLLIVVGATALTGFIVGEYNPNHWNETVRLSFGIGVILAIVVMVMVHKAKEREESLKEREKQLEKVESENKHQAELLNGPAFTFGTRVTEELHKTAMHNMRKVPSLPEAPEN